MTSHVRRSPTPRVSHVLPPSTGRHLSVIETQALNRQPIARSGRVSSLGESGPVRVQRQYIASEP